METLFKSFGIEGKILLWQIVNFGLLFAILWYLLYKPIERLMNEREKKVKASLEEADALAKKSNALEKEFKEKMSEQRRELEEIHKKAVAEQDRLKKQLKEEASKESERILGEARSLAREEQAALLKSAESEIKELALALASKILEKEIDEKTQKKLMEEALKKLATSQ